MNALLRNLYFEKLTRDQQKKNVKQYEIAGETLLLREEYARHVGTYAWDGVCSILTTNEFELTVTQSFLLASYLKLRSQSLQHCKRIVELGSGTGAVSIVASRLGIRINFSWC